MGANLGFAGANNIGINIALSDEKTKYVWILNNDTEVDPDSLTELVNCYKADLNNGIVGSVLLYMHSRKTVQAIGGYYNSWFGVSRHIFGGRKFDQKEIDGFDFSKMDYVVGASMLISRDFIVKVGLMDANYFLYGEDIDWSIRAKKMNLKLMCASKSIVYHKEGATTKSSAKISRQYRSGLSDNYALRSNLILSIKFYPIKHMLVRCIYLLRTMRRLFLGDFNGALRSLYVMFFVWR
jgi:GT2 family glycosyltransferase